MVLLLGAFAYMVESETSSEMTGLRRELDAIVVPDTVVRTDAPDVEMPMNVGANGGSIERTYRPAAGVPVEPAAADFAAALRAQGYDLERTDYTYRQQQLTGWSGRCRATSGCALDPTTSVTGSLCAWATDAVGQGIAMRRPTPCSPRSRRS